MYFISTFSTVTLGPHVTIFANAEMPQMIFKKLQSNNGTLSCCIITILSKYSMPTVYMPIIKHSLKFQTLSSCGHPALEYSLLRRYSVSQRRRRDGSNAGAGHRPELAACARLRHVQPPSDTPPLIRRKRHEGAAGCPRKEAVLWCDGQSCNGALPAIIPDNHLPSESHTLDGHVRRWNSFNVLQERRIPSLQLIYYHAVICTA